VRERRHVETLPTQDPQSKNSQRQENNVDPLASGSSLSRKEEHEKKVAASQALVQERRQQHAQKLAQDQQSKSQRLANVQEDVRRHALVNTIQHWLSKDSSFFVATMDALNLWTQQQKQRITATNNNMEDEQNILHQVVWKQYKQLYYDSILTFREQLGEQKMIESSSSLQNAMAKLEAVGFDDPKWAKRYRQVRGYRLRQDAGTRHLEKQTSELRRLEELLAREKVRLANLEETKRLRTNPKDSRSSDDASKKTSKKEETPPTMEESSPSPFSTVW
jgi:hypothetical protein